MDYDADCKPRRDFQLNFIWHMIRRLARLVFGVPDVIYLYVKRVDVFTNFIFCE